MRDVGRPVVESGPVLHAQEPRRADHASSGHDRERHHTGRLERALDVRSHLVWAAGNFGKAVGVTRLGRRVDERAYVRERERFEQDERAFESHDARLTEGGGRGALGG